MFKREVPLRHGCSFWVRPTRDPYVNWGRGSYDTCDYAHAQSLSGGYRLLLLERDETLAPFIGVMPMYLKVETEIRDGEGFWAKFRSYMGDERKARLFPAGAFSPLQACQLYERVFGTPVRSPLPFDEHQILPAAAELGRWGASQPGRPPTQFLERYPRSYRAFLAAIEHGLVPRRGWEPRHGSPLA